MPSTPSRSTPKGKREKSGKRVEFSPTLSSVGSHPGANLYEPRSPSGNTGITWDTETDHMLSYFLGSEALNNNAAPDYFASSVSASTLRTDEEDEDTDTSPPPRTPALQHFFGSSAYASSQNAGAGKKNQSSAGETTSPRQQYLQQQHLQQQHLQQQHLQQQAGVTNSGSSSSLSAMAAALVSSGGAVFHQQQQPQQFQREGSRESFTPEEPSPISPAALIRGIGGSWENLMLPPPTRPGSATPPVQQQHATNHHHSHRGSSSNLEDQARQQQQQHLAWLQEVNAQARLAASGGTIEHSNNNNNPAAPQHQQHIMVQPLPLHMHSSGYPHPHLAQRQQHSQLLPNQQQQQHHPHHPFVLAAAHHAQQQQVLAAAAAAAAHQEPPLVESEDKRRQRLERNRESARKSRRRKKERLTTLEAAVNKLHNTIEAERLRQIGQMVDGLMKKWRREQIQSLAHEVSTTTNSILPAIRYSGPCSSVSLAILDFQYARLRFLTLPPYQKFLFWFALRDPSFFSAAKEEYARRDSAAAAAGNISPIARPSTGKASSKQIGEELFAAATSRSGGGLETASSMAHDASRTWPLFCFELKFSVDQEDRYVAAQKQVRQAHQQSGSLEHLQSQVATAVRTVDSLGSAVKSVSRAVAVREEKTLVSILSPAQCAAYQTWLASNREVCRNAVPVHDAMNTSRTGVVDMRASLDDICKRLNEVLKISMSQ